MEKLLNKAFEKAKFIALKYVKEIDIAEEVAQLTSIKLYLNYDKIDKTKINSWLFSVTRNLCMDIHRKQKKTQELLVDPLDLSKNFSHEATELNEDLDLDIYAFISVADKKILKKYYNQNVPLAKLAQDFKIKKDKLRRKIYSLENEIKLFHLINSDVVYFNPIPSTSLAKKINNFFKNLSKSLENYDLSSMKRYCKDAIIHDSIKKIKIKSYETCKIKVIEDNNYNIIIAYLDFEKQLKVFNIRFTITKSGNIQVLEMPILPEKVLILDKERVPLKNGSKELINKKGLYNNKLGTIEELEKKKIAKVVQTEDDF